jgi:hypothetical protein
VMMFAAVVIVDLGRRIRSFVPIQRSGD